MNDHQYLTQLSVGVANQRRAILMKLQCDRRLIHLLHAWYHACTAMVANFLCNIMPAE
jgi:hypothetical protein